jgi:hypothetical protein
MEQLLGVMLLELVFDRCTHHHLWAGIDQVHRDGIFGAGYGFFQVSEFAIGIFNGEQEGMPLIRYADALVSHMVCRLAMKPFL